MMLLLLCTVFSCKKMEREENEKTSKGLEVSISQHPGLPFTGKRRFKTMTSVKSRNTPMYFVEIMKNGDVYFSCVYHMNDNDWSDYDYGTYAESYYAGTFQKYMRGYFPYLNDSMAVYEITATHIYEVDQNNQRISKEPCCDTALSAPETLCPCAWELTEAPHTNPLLIEGYSFFNNGKVNI